jgi:hypothetical protein
MIKHTATLPSRLPCRVLLVDRQYDRRVGAGRAGDQVAAAPSKILCQTRRGRREFLELVALQVGGNVGVLDLPREGAVLSVVEKPVDRSRQEGRSALGATPLAADPERPFSATPHPKQTPIHITISPAEAGASTHASRTGTSAPREIRSSLASSWKRVPTTNPDHPGP